MVVGSLVPWLLEQIRIYVRFVLLIKVFLSKLKSRVFTRNQFVHYIYDHDGSLIYKPGSIVKYLTIIRIT